MRLNPEQQSNWVFFFLKQQKKPEHRDEENMKRNQTQEHRT